MTKYSLIITITDSGKADAVMDAAKTAGAYGGTIIRARGAGAKDAESFLGIKIQPEKDMLLILTHEEARVTIMKAISGCEEKTFIFSVPVDDVAGIGRILQND